MRLKDRKVWLSGEEDEMRFISLGFTTEGGEQVIAVYKQFGWERAPQAHLDEMIQPMLSRAPVAIFHPVQAPPSKPKPQRSVKTPRS